MREKLLKESDLFKEIVELLVNKKIDEIKSVTMIYDVRREETMLITFICNGKEETFAVCA